MKLFKNEKVEEKSKRKLEISAIDAFSNLDDKVKI